MSSAHSRRSWAASAQSWVWTDGVLTALPCTPVTPQAMSPRVHASPQETTRFLHDSARGLVSVTDSGPCLPSLAARAGLLPQPVLWRRQDSNWYSWGVLRGSALLVLLPWPQTSAPDQWNSRPGEHAPLASTHAFQELISPRHVGLCAQLKAFA